APISPMAAKTSDRPTGAASRSPSLRSSGGRTMASTDPTAIAPPMASTNQASRSSPRNMARRYSCTSPAPSGLEGLVGHFGADPVVHGALVDRAVVDGHRPQGAGGLVDADDRLDPETAAGIGPAAGHP